MQVYCKDGIALAWHADGVGVPAGEYPPGAQRFIVADGTVLERIGDPPTVDGAPDNRPFKAPDINLAAFAGQCRWERETSGVTVVGIPIATDDRSKLLIMGCRVAAMADAAWTTTWFASDGSTHILDAPTMIAVSDAVAAHVADCFAVYSLVVAGISGGTITTPAQVEDAFAAA